MKDTSEHLKVLESFREHGEHVHSSLSMGGQKSVFATDR